MPLNFTAAQSSRITKPRSQNLLLRRSSSSTFGANSRNKPGSAQNHASKGEDDGDSDEDLFSSRLDDRGPVRSLAGYVKLRGTQECLQYVGDNTFDEIPERAGMNSTRIAEVLNFRRNLPPIVTVTHIHALSVASTQAEREIAQFILRGVVRRMTIPGRGLGSSSIGECLVLVDRWVALVEQSSSLADDTKRKYITALRENPASATVAASFFAAQECSQLLSAGFLTSATWIGGNSSLIAAPDSISRGTLSSIASAGHRAPAGSMAAVGGAGAVHEVGGSGVGGSRQGVPFQVYSFSLPSTGLYLRLLASGREHLLALLRRSKYREAPMGLLRERWDGGVSDTSASSRRRSGLTGPILPGRTKKWKQFYGLKYQWILEECLGTGAIECFETGSVGLGVRISG